MYKTFIIILTVLLPLQQTLANKKNQNPLDDYEKLLKRKYRNIKIKKIRKNNERNKKVNINELFFDNQSTLVKSINKKQLNDQEYYYVVLNKNAIIIDSKNFETFKVKKNKISLVLKNESNAKYLRFLNKNLQTTDYIINVTEVESLKKVLDIFPKPSTYIAYKKSDGVKNFDNRILYKFGFNLKSYFSYMGFIDDFFKISSSKSSANYSIDFFFEVKNRSPFEIGASLELERGTLTHVGELSILNLLINGYVSYRLNDFVDKGIKLSLIAEQSLFNQFKNSNSIDSPNDYSFGINGFGFSIINQESQNFSWNLFYKYRWFSISDSMTFNYTPGMTSFLIGLGLGYSFESL